VLDGSRSCGSGMMVDVIVIAEDGNGNATSETTA
jgi:hypothetical protein